VFNIVEFSR
jgi:hypothetical protein